MIGILLTVLEQFYFDVFNPPLNILKVAGTALGYRHTPEDIVKMTTNWPNRIGIQVTNIETGKIDQFLSVRAAARFLKCTSRAIQKILKNGILFRGTYRIIRMEKGK